jgi:O-antigen/teichoic acid export membrane protein
MLQVAHLINWISRFALQKPSAEGRARERQRRIAITALLLLAARGIGILTGLISIPLALTYLGNERYGLWMSMSSVLAIMSLLDLGIGSALLNVISEANGRENKGASSRYISSAFAITSVVGLMLAGLFIVIYPHIPWDRVYNVSTDQAASEAGPATIVFVACFLVNLPVGLIQKIQLGYQRGYINALWSGAGSVIALGGLVLAIRQEASLPYIILVMAGAPVLASLGNGIWLALKSSAVRVRRTDINLRECRDLVHMGAPFFVLQIAYSVAFQADNIIIAQILGASRVTEYAVPMRLFNLAPLILSFLLIPLWPAQREALARGEIAWVKRSVKRSVLIGLAINVPPSAALMAFGQEAVRLWTQTDLTVPLDLRLGMGIWAIFNVFSGSLTSILNALGAMRFQVTCAALMSLANIIVSIGLTYRIGISGPIYGTVIAQLLFVLAPAAFYLPKLMGPISWLDRSDKAA